MPADRFIHPRLGHSDKVTMLTDFEYRVWTQYLLSADDFGVMRASVVTLQADNDALHAKPQRTVARALEHLISVALVRSFTHQGRRYVYQPDWQDFQKVDYPRPTIEPRPDEAQLAECSEATQELFAKHPGGTGRRKPKPTPEHSAPVLRTVPEPSPNGSQTFPTTRARACEEAKAEATAQADGYGSGDEDEWASRAGRLREELYPSWYAKHRHGARLRLVASTLEFQEAMSLVKTWDDKRLEKLAQIVLTTDDEFIARTDRSFRIFALKASWADDRLRQAESGAA